MTLPPIDHPRVPWHTRQQRRRALNIANRPRDIGDTHDTGRFDIEAYRTPKGIRTEGRALAVEWGLAQGHTPERMLADSGITGKALVGALTKAKRRDLADLFRPLQYPPCACGEPIRSRDAKACRRCAQLARSDRDAALATLADHRVKRDEAAA